MTVLGKTISTDDFYEGQVGNIQTIVSCSRVLGEVGRGYLRVQGGGQDGLPAGRGLKRGDQHGDGGVGVRSIDSPGWHQVCCCVCDPAGQVER